MKTNIFTPSEWNLTDSTETVEITTEDFRNIKKNEKLFAGFSTPAEEKIDNEPYFFGKTCHNFGQREARHYIAQLGGMDIDALSSSWGLELNTLRNSGWGFCYLGLEHDLDHEARAARYLQVARFYGFMSSVATDEKLYALRAINARARSGRGHNSPFTGNFVHEYSAVRFKMGEKTSPYLLEKKIWAVKERALTKHGINISFEVALEALGVSMAPSKAATVAFARKMGSEPWTYREARDFIMHYFLAKKEAEDAGEKLFFIGPHTHVVQRGYIAGTYTYTDVYTDVEGALWDVYGEKEVPYQEWQKSEGKYIDLSSRLLNDYKKPWKYDELHDFWYVEVENYTKCGMGVRVLELSWFSGTRTIFTHPLYGEYDCGPCNDNIKSLYSYAKSTFMVRKKYLTDNQEVERKISVMENNPNVSYIFHFVDSIEAGNCVSGTQAFAKTLGYGEQKVVPFLEMIHKAKRRGVYSDRYFQRAVQRYIQSVA